MTIGSFAVIQDEEGRVLLCHRRDKNLWNLPGGRVEEHESPWQAAEREIKEEIGGDPEITGLMGCWFKTEANDLVFMFLARFAKEHVFTPTDEADEIGYFALDALPANTAPKQRERLLAYVEKKEDWPVLAMQ